MPTVTLSDHDLDIVMQALGELPLKVSGPVFTRLQQQLVPLREPEHFEPPHPDAGVHEWRK